MIGLEVFQDGPGYVFCRTLSMAAKQGKQAVFAEHLAGGVARFPEPVGAEEDDLPIAETALGLGGVNLGGVDAQRQPWPA